MRARSGQGEKTGRKVRCPQAMAQISHFVCDWCQSVIGKSSVYSVSVRQETMMTHSADLCSDCVSKLRGFWAQQIQESAPKPDTAQATRRGD